MYRLSTRNRLAYKPVKHRVQKNCNMSMNVVLKLFQADRECDPAIRCRIFIKTTVAGITRSILGKANKLTCDTQGR